MSVIALSTIASKMAGKWPEGTGQAEVVGERCPEKQRGLPSVSWACGVGWGIVAGCQTVSQVPLCLFVLYPWLPGSGWPLYISWIRMVMGLYFLWSSPITSKWLAARHGPFTPDTLLVQACSPLEHPPGECRKIWENFTPVSFIPGPKWILTSAGPPFHKTMIAFLFV